jgi:predicted transport protein
MIDNLPEKTGKSLAEWKKLLRNQAFAKHGEAVQFLKQEHGVTHGYANTIVTLFRREGDDAEDPVEAQYRGKESLRPIYDRLLDFITGLGDDVTVAPKKTSVSFVRKRQFALVKPATKTRIDLGLKLPDKDRTDRLENSGPFGTMCTHRVRLTEASQVDAELKGWISEAYALAG